MRTVRVELPAHLRTLARTGSEVRVEVPDAPTIADVLDALEGAYPALCGTIRDPASGRRRPFMRFFACGRDLSHEPTDEPLPDPVVRGAEAFCVVGAIAGGAADAEPLELDVDGRAIAISNPGKVMFPEHGETKADLARYYLAVGEPLMRTVRDRPTLLQRFPNGATGSSFFQKRIPDSAPEWLQRTTVMTPNGTTSRAIVMADVAHVLWAANQGCLGFHPWPYRASNPDETDELRLDLDPSPGVTFAMVREAATEVRALLGELGIVAFPKTTGNRGIHLYVRVEPGWDSIAVRQAAVSVAREMERRRPDLITGAWWKEERGPRVFVDFNQNAPHKTVFGAWCVRARVGAQVSTPFAWDDLPTIEPDELSIRTVPARLERLGDPWAAIDDEPQSIEPLVERYRADLAAGIPDNPWPPVYPKMPDEAPRVAPSRARAPSADESRRRRHA